VVPDDGTALADMPAQDAPGEAAMAATVVIDDHGSLLRGGSNLSLISLTSGKPWHRKGQLSMPICTRLNVSRALKFTKKFLRHTIEWR
jgi:hypothetical protein